MKVSLVSDLHLDYSGYLDMPGGEVLILAGDICEVRSMRRDLEDLKVKTSTPNKEYPSSEFFFHECAKYKKVFMVMGNHESYGGRLEKTYGILKSMLPDNVTVLENEVQEYEGVMFLGATMWTDLNKNDPGTILTLKTGMHDYRSITQQQGNNYFKLTPERTASEHTKTVEYFKRVLESNRDKPFVVISHHAPSYLSIHDNYKHDKYMNGGYASDLSELILDFPNIVRWCHGHTHNPFDYMIGSTRVLCNPRGYVPHEAGNGFDVNFTFEL
jgi:predicted MPP superfamily phosphohydrolase